MIDLKVTALAGLIGLAAVDTGAPTDSVHNIMFNKTNLYTSEETCRKHIETIERQKPELKGDLNCLRH